MSYSASTNSSLSELDSGSGWLEERLGIINATEDWIRTPNLRLDIECKYVLERHMTLCQGWKELLHVLVVFFRVPTLPAVTFLRASVKIATNWLLTSCTAFGIPTEAVHWFEPIQRRVDYHTR